MNEFPSCPKCQSVYTYSNKGLFVCPECGYEWSVSENSVASDIFDQNGTKLASGDSVIVSKDLKIKGTSSTIKRGTKVRNIRLTQDDGVGHDIECKFPGVGTIKLKSSLVKKG